MGRIRTHFVKNTSFELVKQNPEKFGVDFASNKSALKEMGIFSEKFTINKIAGYITRIVKSKNV